MSHIVFTVPGIVKLLSNLNPAKASGQDLVPARILKLASMEIAPILCIIFQQSYNTGQVPLDWQKANVTAVFIKGVNTNPANYRPVSLTCIIICKTMEHVIYSQIMNHLDSHHIPVEFQHGLRSNHSCETQLLNTVEDLSRRLHVRIQKFSSGDGGSRSIFSLFYRSQMVNFKENYHFSRFPRGSNIFQGRGPTFSRGSNCLFPIETHIACYFLGGGGPDPLPPPSGSALGLDKRQTTDLLILYFSKAFDTVAHRRLLHKIHHYGITGKTNMWIKSWLCNRQQRVVLDGSASAYSPVLLGVPQGTVLGPLMFLLCVNDIDV